MWYGMNKSQQILLGITGVLLFGFFFIIIIIENKFLEDAGFIVWMVLILLIISAFSSVVLHIKSGK